MRSTAGFPCHHHDELSPLAVQVNHPPRRVSFAMLAGDEARARTSTYERWLGPRETRAWLRCFSLFPLSRATPAAPLPTLPTHPHPLPLPQIVPHHSAPNVQCNVLSPVHPQQTPANPSFFLVKK